jgi:uracil-DNA glycosylase
MTRLNKKIISCQRCPRLRKYCKNIAKIKRRSFAEDKYWQKPVPNFGDSKGEFLIVGLAPAAHGANRTGRMFTGDRSGEWLYRAMFRAGLANQAECKNINDGLQLTNSLITAVIHCAPPDNKPNPKEIANCREYFTATINEQKPKAILALGSIAWNAICSYYQISPRPKFAHGASFRTTTGVSVVGSYHPSQQNTFTKRLTEEMFDNVFKTLKNSI